MPPARPTTYEVKLWKTEKYAGSKVTTYTVRWSVGGKARRKSFRTAAMADSFRSDLVVAQRKGEAFEIEAGLPLSLIRRSAPVISWYEFACSYVDMKWPNASPKHRKSIAESLVTVTMAMLNSHPDSVRAKKLRSALLNYGFNAKARDLAADSTELSELLTWVGRQSRPIGDLGRMAVIRQVLDALGTKVDGERAAPRTATLKRTILSNALDYAVERNLLESNLLAGLKKPKH